MPTARPRRPARVRTASAAGGVVMRGAGDDAEVVLAGRTSDGTWVFPKGTPDPGESIEETALREVREETGLDVSIVVPIGVVDYWFAVPGERVHKFVHFFLMRAVGGDVSRHDREYDDVRWVAVRDARRTLSFETYREILDRAIEASRAAA
ncbi:MAG TPA: NUDIX hydrolase [Candidatus Limnocylindria bacterium]|jgi:8-oxo-dGTP pyrophosphatase MutT (NUDIX family)|nr:NUDIX hydrolase [Candidatus Limnocylindria bacterium]